MLLSAPFALSSCTAFGILYAAANTRAVFTNPPVGFIRPPSNNAWNTAGGFATIFIAILLPNHIVIP
jgi:hypothetical protein